MHENKGITILCEYFVNIVPISGKNREVGDEQLTFLIQAKRTAIKLTTQT